MSTYSDVELPVTVQKWTWRMRNDRIGRRRRIEGEIAIRWLRRYVERTAATVASDPVVSWSEDHADYFVRNEKALQLSVRLILGGRRFGLPEVFHVQADVLAVPVPDQVAS